MTKGDPEDPLPILGAVNELARNWAELDGESDRLDGSEVIPSSPVWDMSEAQLKRHYGSWTEASEGVFRVAVLSLKIRVWVATGPDWRRPTIHTIRELLPPKSGLYVDQEEVRRVFGNRWPGSFLPPSDRLSGKPGPKPGPGYNPKDVPVFKMILEAQRQSGNVEKQHYLVTRFATQATGQSPEANVERLRKALPKWLAHNGIKWEGSN